MENKFITLAIHSHSYASALCDLLAAHNIEAQMEDFCVGRSAVSVGAKVSVSEADLPIAIKISESGQSLPGLGDKASGGPKGTVLIPVDYSHYSMLAIKAGFEFARRLNLHPRLLHTFAVPLASSRQTGFTDSFTSELPDMQQAEMMRAQAQMQMKELRRKIDTAQHENSIPSISYSISIAEGIPEEVILEYTKVSPPVLIVMATRGKSRREADLIGSVTAEVLDSCRVPVFTVPENITFIGVENITRLLFFCNLDRQDSLSIDSLMRMFDYPRVDITLVPVTEKGSESDNVKIRKLAQELGERYPLSTFHSFIFRKDSFREDLERTVSAQQIQLLIVPNKKTNIFARLFKPGIAHRILFERDMPMLALPV